MAQIKKIIGLTVFYFMCGRSLKGLCTIYLIISRKTNSQIYSTQHCLICMLEMWEVTMDEEGYVCAIFMDLSKAFDTLNHNLLITKLEAYGFKRESLLFMKSYLKLVSAIFYQIFVFHQMIALQNYEK